MSKFMASVRDDQPVPTHFPFSVTISMIIDDIKHSGTYEAPKTIFNQALSQLCEVALVPTHVAALMGCSCLRGCSNSHLSENMTQTISNSFPIRHLERKSATSSKRTCLFHKQNRFTFKLHSVLHSPTRSPSFSVVLRCK